MKQEEGFREQFKDWFETHFEKLCVLSYRIVKDKEEAREVTQQVFMQLWEDRYSWTTIRSIQAYLYTLVYNRSINAYKKIRDKKNNSITISKHSAQVREDTSLEIQELEKAIAEGVDQLPSKCKEIFLLSREEEFTYKQIADHLGISIKTVETQMGIALKRLRAHIEKEHNHLFPFFLFFL